MKKKIYSFAAKWSALLSLVLCALIIATVVAVIPFPTKVKAEESNVRYIEVKSGSAWSSVIYISDVTLSAMKYYKFSFDYKEISGSPIFRIEGMGSSGSYKPLSDFCYQTSPANMGALQDVVENGVTKKVATCYIKTKITSIRITIGAYEEATDMSCAFANPVLVNCDKTYTKPNGANLLSDLSEGNVYDVMAEDPSHKSNLPDKWNLRYLTGKRSTLVVGELTPAEYAEYFAPPKYMIRFYEGCQNAVAEYTDTGVNLSAGNYEFKCKYRLFSGDALMELAYSTDGGSSYNTVTAEPSDANGERTVAFSLPEAANAFRVRVGNNTDAVDTSLAFACPTLVKAGQEESFIAELNQSTVNLIDIDGASVNGKWNIKRDSVNQNAVAVVKVTDGYFDDRAESLKYEMTAGNSWTRVEYLDDSVKFQKDKTYLFTADFKLKSGDFNIGVSGDPALNLNVGGNTVKPGAEKFSNIYTYFDEAAGVVTVKFTPKENLTGVKIICGSYEEALNGSCAIAHPKLVEYYTKTNGVTVYYDSLIQDITADTAMVNTGGNENVKWNMRHAGKPNSFVCDSIPDGFFTPSSGYIKIQKGATKSTAEYLDDTVTFEAGKTYRLTMNYRVYSGNPTYKLYVKSVAGDSGSYRELSKDAEFLTSFDDTVDETTYSRTVTFVPAKDLSGLKVVVGNPGTETNISVCFANPELYAIDEEGLAVNENMIADINRPNIKRNQADQRIWNLVSTDDANIIYQIPVLEGTFVPSKMVHIRPNYNWNRAIYYDDSFVFEPNTTYRFNVDYKGLTGSPAFEVLYRNPGYKSVINMSTSYSETFDADTCIRSITFTTGDTISQPGLGIEIGNSSESTSVSCVFANPQLCKVVDGNIVGGNLIKDVTDETVVYMGTMQYSGIWNLRYIGSKGGGTVLEDIPENYFRVPTLVSGDTDGSVTRFITAKPNTTYMLTYKCKNKGTGSVTPFIEAYTNSTHTALTKTQVKQDFDGYYNYYCEFKTPSNLRDTDNLRVGCTFAAADAGITDIDVRELNSGFEPVGLNLVTNSNFSESSIISDYADGLDGWLFEGKKNDLKVLERSNAFFALPVSKMLVFSGKAFYEKQKVGSQETLVVTAAGGTIGRTLSLKGGKQYTLSLNLKYANPGYEGETGVDIYYHNGTDWKKLDVQLNEASDEYKLSGSFTLPEDARSAENMKFEVRVKSQYVSGYLANAVLTEKGSDVNLIENGNFSNGIIGWNMSGYFRLSEIVEIPEHYFGKTVKNTPNMIVYRDTSSWVRFNEYVTLKPNAYYKLVANAVHPWQNENPSEFALQRFGYKAADGGKLERTDTFFSSVDKENNGTYFMRIYHTDDLICPDEGASLYLYMEGAKNAGYWGDIAIYECDENGNILSDNILINGDFSLGLTGWTSTGEFTYRIVEQPKDFFKTYTKDDDTMIVSNGIGKNITLGQTISVERGKKYYFSGFYVNMNSNGITPKVLYQNTSGKTVEASLNMTYDSNRYFFEAEFTLPDDAKSVRGLTDVQFVISNNTAGKAYVTNLMVCEEGKYENLYQNPDFKDGLKKWSGNQNGNYSVVPFDSSVFVFYYDDKKFNDGDWSGEGGTGMSTGKIIGSVVDGDFNSVSGVTLMLQPGNIRVSTDDDGCFCFNNIKPGEYKLNLLTENGTVIFVTNVTVTAGMESSVSQIQYYPAEYISDDVDEYTEEWEDEGETKTGGSKKYGRVCGYLFYANGQAIIGQDIYLGNIASQQTKKKGTFEFNDIPAGKYDLYIKDKDGAIRILKTVEVLPGSSKILKIKLPVEVEAEQDLTLLYIIIAIIALIVLLAGAMVVFLIVRKKKKAAKAAQ